MKWAQVGKTLQAEHPADTDVMAQVHEERRNGDAVYRWRVFRKGEGNARELLRDGERVGQRAAMDDAEAAMQAATGRARGLRW